MPLAAGMMGKMKCRILYDQKIKSIDLIEYDSPSINSLKLMEWPGEERYDFKFADRDRINQLYAQRGDGDDVLFHHQGWILDTSYANVAFQRGGRWYTPSFPLLAGTTWKRLVVDGVIIPRPIPVNEISSFEKMRVFNAMNDWGEAIEIDIHSISRGDALL